MKKNKKVSVIMYHYVRDMAKTRYPGIKALEVVLFKRQIKFLRRHYNVITMEALIASLNGQECLPEDAALLTFDDAYLDHFQYVFPLLDEHRLQGSFFPSAEAIMGHKVLAANKIHYILASVEEKELLLEAIFRELDRNRKSYSLRSNKYYFAKLAKQDIFDTKEVIFIKRLLQVGLPEGLRSKIVDALFAEFVAVDERALSRELYMDVTQLKCMRRNGMHIGCHGYAHEWLNSLTYECQERDIDGGIEFLDMLGTAAQNRSLAYPYGAYNKDTITILRDKGVQAAFTTEPAVADLARHGRYELPRLDANDLTVLMEA